MGQKLNYHKSLISWSYLHAFQTALTLRPQITTKVPYRRLNIKTSYMDFFQKSTFLNGGILCSNAHILSKRRTPTPIISGV